MSSIQDAKESPRVSFAKRLLISVFLVSVVLSAFVAAAITDEHPTASKIMLAPFLVGAVIFAIVILAVTIGDDESADY